MKFDKHTRALAAKLVEDGFAAMLAEGITLELATREYRHKSGRMIPFGYNEIRLKMHTESVAEVKPDSARADIQSSGAAGSEERIAAYAVHYGEKNDTQSIVSPFTLDLEQLGDKLADLLTMKRWRETSATSAHNSQIGKLLLALKEARGTKTISEIAAKIGVPPVDAHDLLKELRQIFEVAGQSEKFRPFLPAGDQ